MKKIDFSPRGKVIRVLWKDRLKDKLWDKEARLCGENVCSAMSSSVAMIIMATDIRAKVVNINTARRQ